MYRNQIKSLLKLNTMEKYIFYLKDSGEPIHECYLRGKRNKNEVKFITMRLENEYKKKVVSKYIGYY